MVHDLAPELLEGVCKLSQGRLGVAVSGGPDSVALLHLLVHHRPELVAVVLHVDHAARRDSHTTAQWVQRLAEGRGHAFASTRLTGGGNETTWRHARLSFFSDVAKRHRLDGVALGHHLDDHVETVLLRLLRGSPRSGTFGLAGLSTESRVGDLNLLRPLLAIRKQTLLDLLQTAGQVYQVDASNQDRSVARNRLRRLLARHPHLRDVAEAFAAATRAADDATLDAAGLPSDAVPQPAEPDDPVARRRCRQWLTRHGVPEADASPEVVDRLMSVVKPDGPRVVTLPGDLRLRRRGKTAGGGIVMTRANRDQTPEDKRACRNT